MAEIDLAAAPSRGSYKRCGMFGNARGGDLVWSISWRRDRLYEKGIAIGDISVAYRATEGNLAKQAFDRQDRGRSCRGGGRHGLDQGRGMFRRVSRGRSAQPETGDERREYSVAPNFQDLESSVASPMFTREELGPYVLRCGRLGPPGGRRLGDVPGNPV